MDNNEDPKAKLPLVYSCSGCSSAAQLANHLAIKLDRSKLAEMSCIAGVGGDVAPLVRTALSGRRIVAIDGCSLNCSNRCLARHGITPDLQITLSEHGIKKRLHTDFSQDDAVNIFELLVSKLREMSGR
jgi:uncharacterized metal-binding protein